MGNITVSSENISKAIEELARFLDPDHKSPKLSYLLNKADNPNNEWDLIVKDTLNKRS